MGGGLTVLAPASKILKFKLYKPISLQISIKYQSSKQSSKYHSNELTPEHHLQSLQVAPEVLQTILLTLINANLQHNSQIWSDVDLQNTFMGLLNDDLGVQLIVSYAAFSGEIGVIAVLVEGGDQGAELVRGEAVAEFERLGF